MNIASLKKMNREGNTCPAFHTVLNWRGPLLPPAANRSQNQMTLGQASRETTEKARLSRGRRWRRRPTWAWRRKKRLAAWRRCSFHSSAPKTLTLSTWRRWASAHTALMPGILCDLFDMHSTAHFAVWTLFPWVTAMCHFHQPCANSEKKSQFLLCFQTAFNDIYIFLFAYLISDSK